MRDSSSKQILLSVLGVAILVIAVVGVSFAAFAFSKTGTKENTISSGTISMTYTEGTAISINNAMPMTDAAGKVLSGTGQVFTFTVGATISGTATVSYEIAAIKKSGTIADSNIRLYLEKSTTGASGTFSQSFAPGPFVARTTAGPNGAPVGSMILESGTFTTTKTNDYKLRMWLKDTAPITGTSQNYTVTVNVYAKA